jgi:hypothetical protein
MATTWVMGCGCRETDGTSGPAREVTLRGLCTDCRAARIGQTIRFLRFGHLPASGASFNHRDRTSEEGVSVYEVIRGRADLVGWHFDFLGRVAYRGTGVIVGWGSDGEPLVAEVSSLRRIGPKEVARLTERA